MTILKYSLFTLALAALALLSAGTLGAQPEIAPQEESGSGNPEIHDQLTLQEIMTIMKAQKYEVELFADKEVVAWIIADEVCLVSTDKPNSLNFYTYVSGGKFTLEDANKWNRDYKYSKTYLDDENDVALELDLNLAGGVAEERIISFLKTCEISYRQFLKVAK
ncbi:MAG: YbjN domain-containing protein [Deltaproteobacteria bacterium]|nr:YbjN domain-containing protein [Deltaproteobacteria bacterium]